MWLPLWTVAASAAAHGVFAVGMAGVPAVSEAPPALEIATVLVIFPAAPVTVPVPLAARAQVSGVRPADPVAPPTAAPVAAAAVPELLPFPAVAAIPREI